MFWDLVLPSHQLPCSIAPRVGVGYLEVWLHHLVKAWLGQGMALASALVLQRKELSNEGAQCHQVVTSMWVLNPREFLVLNSTSFTTILTVLFNNTTYSG